jgi:hypothetical protein
VAMDEQDVQRALARVQTSTRRLEELRASESEISAGRTQDMVLLRRSGVSREVIAEAAGLTPARVTQLLGRVGESRRQSSRPIVIATVEPQRERPVNPVKVVPGPALDPHRHHYVSVAWNHMRGGYLVRQKCECGLVRVIPVTSIPKELAGRYADTSVVA